MPTITEPHRPGLGSTKPNPALKTPSHPYELRNSGGDGAWLSVFAEHGISDFVGIDGDYIDESMLLIPPERFLGRDLEKGIEIDRSFDLAVSLEVAEHLSPESAEGFVTLLTRLAPAVLFSAAIPGQEGVHHVNEQWPDHWAALFANHGFQPLDAIRRRVWEDEDVEFWYAQNTLLYVSEAVLHTRPRLRREMQTYGGAMAVVHPHLYLGKAARGAPEEPEPTARELLAKLPRAMRRSAAWRLRWLRDG